MIGDSHAQDIPQVNGTIAITDQDLGDTLTLSVTGNATASYNGGTLPVAAGVVDVSALIASGAISFDPATSNGGQQIINWHYDPAAADLDWLRAGDTLTLTYVAQVNDGHGNVGAQNLVITITGTNDVPTIGATTNPLPIAEVIGDSHAQDIPQVNGTIAITDQDLGDTLTLSVTGNATASYNGGTLPVAAGVVDVSALIASGAISFDPATSNGGQQIINWHYDPAAADLDWLRAGDTLTLTYVAQVNDGHGNVGAQNLVITITGTNDVPTIGATTNPLPIAEVIGDSHAQDIPQVNGTIAITDQDLGDTLTLSVTGNATASYNGGTLPVAAGVVDVSALIASGAISFDPATSNGGQQIINWHYDPAAADLDWLRAGDTLTLTYVAQVNDGHGNVGAQNLVITITGTNDVPTIGATTNPLPIAEVIGDSHAQDIPQVNGTIAITDQDLGDTLTLSVTGNATASYNGGTLPVAAGVVDVSALIASGAISFDPATSNGGQQIINWHYDPAAADLDWLRAGDTLTLTYVAQVNDGHGNVGAQNLVITITGTNDVPTIGATTNPLPIAEVIGDSHAQDIPQVNGTIAITDQDLGDTLTLSVTGNATASYNGGTLPVAAGVVDVSALIASGAISFDPATSNGGQQIINWHYDPAAADLDWLRAGDTLTLTYVAQVNDGHGNVGAQNLVITITGTNDVPTIGATTNPLPIAEVIGDSHAQDIPQVNGTIAITDQDLGDTLTLSVTGNATASYNGGTLPVAAGVVDVSALIASGAISFDPATSNGGQQIINWHYDPAAADLDWLRAGDTLTLTYVAQVNDGHGNVGAQNLVITITGTNDVPTIGATTNPLPIAEVIGDSHAQDIPQVNGTIAITDQDLGDTLTLSVTGNATASYNGGTLPVAAGVVDVSALIASGAISFDPATSNGGQQIINWHYDPAAADLDWLRAGDTLTLTYVAQVNDGHGNVGAQNLVITITGTNDVPTIGATTNPLPIAEVIGDSHAQDIPQVNGTIAITDQDLGDTLTLSVTGNATASYNGGTLPVAAGVVDVSALIASGAISFDPATSNGGQQIINWHYDPAAADLDWLRAGDTLTLTYVAQVNDGHGNVGAQNLVITITGTNDVPTIGATTNPLPIAEVIGDSHAQDIPQVNGTIAITDQDLGDTLTLSVTGNATASYNGGTLPVAAGVVDVSALIASGAISFDPATSNGGQQIINWHYDPAAADLDWLRAGDTLTLTYVAQVNDGHGNVGAQNLVITITGTNDAPVVDLDSGSAGNDATVSFTEQTPLVIAPSATITDVNSANLTSLTATLTARPDGNTLESLSLNAAATTAAAGLTVSYTPSTGVLSVTGSASKATYQTILDGIVYNDTSDAPTTTSANGKRGGE